MVLFPVGIVLILGFVYTNTIALDLTWSHFSADAGDLIAAAATGGVPHPSGYPLYLILARFFLYLPSSTYAFRTNLLSMVSTILAALLVYGYLVEQFQGKTLQHYISFLAAITYGLAKFVWGQALVTEVYALHGLLMIACLFALSKERNRWIEWVRGFVFGLAASNHLTAITLFPLLLFDFQQNRLLEFRLLLKRLVGVIIGLSPYLLLPLRASQNPPINWGDASTLSGFLWLISGRIYQPYWFSLTGLEMIQRSQAFAGLLVEQFTWVGVMLGIYGLLSKPPRRVVFPTMWMGIIYLFISIVFGSRDSQVNLMPFWLVFTIWIAYGLHDLLAAIRKKLWIRWVLLSVHLGIVLANVPSTFVQLDLTDDHQARDFIVTTMNRLPQRALVFVEGDEQIFSLWYAQFAEHQRADLIIIADDLLPYDWYLKNLQQNYPGLGTPSAGEVSIFDLSAANPDRVICYIGFIKTPDCR